MTSRIPLIALSLALLCLSGCSRSPESAIEHVLNRCAKISESINEQQLPAADAAYQFSAQMQEIDTRDCPQEFRVAFQEHINAWRMGSEAFANDTMLVAMLEGFYSGFTGDTSVMGQSANQSQQVAAYINQTYFQLTEIATYYGARVPNSEIKN